MRARSVAATAVLWAAFVAALQIDGTWERLGEDVIALSVFASGFALLTYALDSEARGALDRWSSRALLAAAFASIALGGAAPRAVGLLVALPVLMVVAVASARRSGPARVDTGDGVPRVTPRGS